ncbi:MAG: type II toxin-antitoxin system prevent-host-death family antitoxin [Phycisphaerales bacterium]|nr:type II toxin-antitoxin system prevent-host-death family antitoxin [Phycisphaerales bacterium]
MDDRGNEIGAYDAKTHFAALLQRVAAGEELTITRNGEPIARMVPVRRSSAAEKKAAVAAIKKLAVGNKLRSGKSKLSVTDLIREGRR